MENNNVNNKESIKISAVINTYNEESNIAFCLKGLLWCDEILVVDMESEDKTVEIAKSIGAKVISIPKIREFDQARKVAIDNAKYDWVLLVDADEIITESLSTTILQYIKSDNSQAAKLPRLNYIFGKPMKYCGQWPDYQLRLFKKEHVVVTGEVHNFLHLKENIKLDFFNKKEEDAIIHFTYNNVESYINKINLYTSLEIIHEKRNGRGIVFSGLKEFVFRYFRLRGFLAGKDGFVYSLLLALYKIIKEIKINEKADNIDIDEIKESINVR